MNYAKEIEFKLLEIKSKLEGLIETFNTEEDENKLKEISHSNFDHILHQKALNFKVTA